MTQDSAPVTPPPELVYRLQDLGNLDAIELAYQAGADQELEACCEWVEREIGHGREWGAELRTTRRPKPPSLKKQALLLCDDYIDPEGIIRRALEQLND